MIGDGDPIPRGRPQEGVDVVGSSTSTTPAGARQLLLPVSARGSSPRGDLAGNWMGSRGPHPGASFLLRCWGGDGTEGGVA